MEIKYIKSAARLLDRDCVNKLGLDLSKEILLVSVGQLAAKFQTVKVSGLKRNLLLVQPWATKVQTSSHFFK